MAWIEILDAQVAAYAPPTGRLKRALRDNFASRVWVFRGNLESNRIQEVNDTASAWVAASDTFGQFVPIGAKDLDGRAELTIIPDIEIVLAGTGTVTGECRLKHGSDTSNSSGTVTRTTAGTTRTQKDALVLEFTPTGDAVEEITVEFKAVNTATISGSVTLYIPRDRPINYVKQP